MDNLVKSGKFYAGMSRPNPTAPNVRHSGEFGMCFAKDKQERFADDVH